MAHELRTPLSVAMIQCEDLLARERPGSLRPWNEVEPVERKVASMGEMVSQLLLLSLVDQGRERLPWNPWISRS